MEGKKPPIPTVPSVRHDGALACTNGRHLATAQCNKGAERKFRRLAEEDIRESTDRAFQAYGKPLEMVNSFKYLAWVMTAGDDD